MTASDPTAFGASRAQRKTERLARREATYSEQRDLSRPVGSRGLDVGEFSFYGFDDLQARVARRLGNVGVRSGTPEVMIVEDAVYIPAVDHGRAARGAGHPRLAGGLIASDGRPIEAAHLRRNRGRAVSGLSDAVAAVPVREVTDEVLYLGWLSDHFGRLLLESLARVWFLPQVVSSVPLVFHFPDAPPTLPDWVARILEAFGVPPARILVPEEPTRFRRIIIPEPLFEQLHGAHEMMIRPFHSVAVRLAGDARLSTQPVYLSRRLLTSVHRPVVGEGELEDVLRENGFLIAHPEKMSFDEQVRLFNTHADIFSGVGSAAHSVLFALGKPMLHLLANGDRIPSNFFLCSALAGAPTAFVNCLGTGDRPSFATERKQRQAERGEDRTGAFTVPGAGSQATPQLLDTGALVGYLRERGFLKTTLRASLAGRDPALRRRYDEAWFYARLRTAADQGETLPSAIADEATSIADGSWPVTLMLGRYHASAAGDASHVRALMGRFADLAATESDVDRLAYYHGEVGALVAPLTRWCDAPTRARLGRVLLDRFLITLDLPDDAVEADTAGG